jgi:hypothetical protein
MSNSNFKKIAWKRQLAKKLEAIQKEKDYLCYWRGEDALADYEHSVYFHQLYKEADDLVAKIQGVWVSPCHRKDCQLLRCG